MELKILSDKIDPESIFATYFQLTAWSEQAKMFAKGTRSAHNEQELFDILRERIDNEMMDFLLMHEGMVDGWPDPETDLEIRSATSGKVYRFNYFSRSAMGDLLLGGSKYRNHYKYEYTELYKETIEKGTYYGVTPKENRRTIAKYWLARLPIIFAVMAFICGVLNLFGLDYMQFLNLIEGVNAGTVTIVSPALDVILLYPLALIFGIPCGFAMFVDELLVKKIGILGLFVGFLIMLGIAYGCYRWIIFKWDDPRPLKQKELKKKFKEKARYRRSEEYKQIVSEEEARRQMRIDLSEKWHQAWYNCYKRSQYR